MMRAMRPRRARNALACGAVCFVLLQAGLFTALSLWWPLRDPEFGRRLVHLRARMAERPNRPLVVLLGSSRVAMGFRPELMRTNDRSGAGPVVFNLALCGSGPMMEGLAFKRLLDSGVRPTVVVAEAWPAVLHWSKGELQDVAVDRLTLADVRTLSPYYADGHAFRQAWRLRHWCPSHGERLHLLGQWAPRWLSPGKLNEVPWKYVDEWGWLRHPMADVPSDEPAGARLAKTAPHEKANLYSSTYYEVHKQSLEAYRVMADRCRRKNIELVFVSTPDPFDYPPEARSRMDGLLRQLSRDLAVPLIDARSWATKHDFVEGIHLTHRGAEAFTRRFEREIQPCLDGQPFARRYPPGTLEAPRVSAEEKVAGR